MAWYFNSFKEESNSFQRNTEEEGVFDLTLTNTSKIASVSGCAKNWYSRVVKADSPYYRKVLEKKRQDKTNKDAVALFDYIRKNRNMTISFFHGTSSKTWDSIQKTGFFSSPKIRNVAYRESRTSGLDEVFFTTQINYAFFYANRSSQQDSTPGNESMPVILHLEIPAIWIKEVSEVILNPETASGIYNEFNLQSNLQEILQKNLSIEEKANAVLEFFIERHLEHGDDEFTIMHVVPVRFVKNTTLSSKTLLKGCLENITRNIRDVKKLIPQKWQKDKEIAEIVDSKTTTNPESYGPSEIEYAFSGAHYLIYDPSNKSAVEYFEKLINLITSPDYHNQLKKQKITEEQFVDTLIGVYFYNDYDGIKGSIDILKMMDQEGSFINQLCNNFPIFNKKFADLLKNTKSYINATEIQSSIGKEDALSTRWAYGQLKEDLSLCQQNIDLLEKYNIFYKEDIDSFVKDNANTLRNAYLFFLDNYSLAEQDRQEGYTFRLVADTAFGGNGPIAQPPLEQDPEALRLFQQRNRFLYLRQLLRSSQKPFYNFDNKEIDKISKLYSQNDISSDKEAQDTIVNGLVKKITDPARHNFDFRKTNPYKNYNKKNQSDPKILLPDWILNNPESMTKIRNAYQAFSDETSEMDFEINYQNTHPSIINNESGPIDFKRNSLLKILSDDSKGFPNLYLVEKDEQLLSLYIEKLRKFLEVEKANPVQQFNHALFSYRHFGKNGETRFDPVISNISENVIINYASEHPSSTRTTILTECPNVWSISARETLENIFCQVQEKEYSNLIFQIDVINNLEQRNPSLLSRLYKISEEKIMQSGKDNEINNLYDSVIKRDSLIKISNETGILKKYANQFCIKLMKNIFEGRTLSTIRTLSTNIWFGSLYNTWVDQNEQFVKEISAIIENNIKIGYNNILSNSEDPVKKSISLVNLIKSCCHIVRIYLASIASSIQNEQFMKLLESISLHAIQLFLSTFEEYYKEGMKIQNYAEYTKHQSTSYFNSYTTVSEISSLSNLIPLSEVIKSQTKKIVTMNDEAIKHYHALYAKLLSTPKTPAVNPTPNDITAGTWYKRLKTADKERSWKQFNEINSDEAYDKFKKTYDEATGWSWSKEQFLRKAPGWRFYGDNSGYISIREQGSGMLKLVGMAGSMKGIYRGMQDLLKETSPVWGAVTKNIADMAKKVGFNTVDPMDVQENIHKIPSSVFGGAKIQSVQPDGGIVFVFRNDQKAIKYLIGNSAYISLLNAQKGAFK